MMIDWNFVLSIVTSIVAVIALIISVVQIKISNRQNLFERRLDLYMKAKGLIALYGQNRNLLESKKKDEDFFAIDLDFIWLTNNTFLEEMQEVISEPLEQPQHKIYLKKKEELYRISEEIALVFSGKEAETLSRFVLSYTELLHKMYQYQILIKDIQKDNEKEPTSWKILRERYGEKSYRDEVLEKYKELKKSYDILCKEKVEAKIIKQMKLR